MAISDSGLRLLDIKLIIFINENLGKKVDIKEKGMLYVDCKFLNPLLSLNYDDYKLSMVNFMKYTNLSTLEVLWKNYFYDNNDGRMSTPLTLMYSNVLNILQYVILRY